MITYFISPVIFLFLLIIMFLIVPYTQILKFLNLGLIGGLVVALVLIYFMQNFYGYWDFVNIDIWHFIEIPIFLSAAWIPVVIIFAHFLNKIDYLSPLIFIILIFPAGATFLHYLFIYFDLLAYSDWNLFYTFLVSLGIHSGITYYLFIRNQLGVKIGVKQ